MTSQLFSFCLFAFAILLIDSPCRANVPAPATPPSPPAGYCSTIYTELDGYLNTFNKTLGTPASYPTLQLSQLQMADSNSGPVISGPNYLNSVMVQVQQLKAMGFKGIKVEVGFPVLYEPFFGSEAALQPYLNFYQDLAQNLKSMDMKLLVENNVLLSTGDEVGWTNLTAYYASLNWDQFIAGRATMAGTIAKYMDPDYLMLSEEPDTEAANTGQTNLNNPVDAAAMIAGEITSVRLLSLTMPLGAGFGTWMAPSGLSSLTAYLTAYVALPLNYIDMHIYPINTEYNDQSNFLDNALTIANGAAVAGKQVAISESWMWKMENSEFNVDSPNEFRSRDPFSFWSPLDSYFIQTMQKLAKYTKMLYLTSQGNNEFLAYQTYGGTEANGGEATCTCTTGTCSEGDITSEENSLAANAGTMSEYTTTGFSYNSLLVTPVDKTPPTAPQNLSATAGYNTATLTWTASTDNVGVAGYNIYRCSPSPCTGVWIANATGTTYYDKGLTDNTSYEYHIQAFDMANNLSAMSNSFTVTTADDTPPEAPTHTVATAISSSEITLTWTPPPGNVGSNKIYRNTLPTNLVEIATMPGTADSYNDRNLNPSTKYYYGVVAMEDNLGSPMSEIASATTLPDN